MTDDLDAIRSRMAKAGAFSVPRWVAADITTLLTEVVRLREGAPPTTHDAEMRKLQSRVWVLERDLARHRETSEAEAARLEKIAASARLVAAAREEEAEAERLAVTRYLCQYASDTPPGPISPVRKAAQAFALRAADFIQRGEHRREETAP